MSRKTTSLPDKITKHFLKVDIVNDYFRVLSKIRIKVFIAII